MLSTEIGNPIAKIEEGHNKIKILGLVNPDNKEDAKELQKIKGGKGGKCKKIIKKQKKCCKNHSNKYCNVIGDECCDDCPYFSDNESDSESDNEKFIQNAKKIIDEKFRKDFYSSHKLIPLPNLEKRAVEYITGPAGSGKSTMCANLAQEFKKTYPEKSILIFCRSEVKNDPAYAKLNPKQFELTNDIVVNPIDIEKELNPKGSLCIFDDTETILDKKIHSAVEKLIIDALVCGRKLDCSVFVTSHLVIPQSGKHFSRNLLNEVDTVTVFPKFGSKNQIEYALKTYWSLDKQEIEKIMKIDSRWIRVTKSYPRYVMYENGCYLL